MGWRGIESAPQTGEWVWGEWEALLSPTGEVLYPRIVEPMRWDRTQDHVHHWMMRDGWTPGPDPVRWAPMLAPPPEDAVHDGAWGAHTGVVDGWIIVRDPGCVPELKRPMPRNEDGLDAMLAELARLRPDSALTVARLTSHGDLWVEDGRERLEIGRALGGMSGTGLASHGADG